ncbi:tRNA pseudouridine(55) synthase TruB [Blastochloris sulfoviridis]|uniref:tRNA pseudouridine synthase B n=1 Tax=Blastochloris sulfoviridis TaxID=50712 RepID=A0A5M6I158_9HYPH|nr:tRNA pseudouridine(55) synthase TruB [Blastochloris sulfoviridis]KAA5601896.1 tRNA pseudouridine(55) synthase TruB [Blastochloris sulfoviridis]
MNAPRRIKRDVDGWLILDKPVGMTSTHAVSIVKRAFQAKKAGHAGTLDPLASGVLPIALGEATKTVPMVMDGRKAYRFTVRWGIETDTDDAEGRAIATSDVRPDPAAVKALLPRFTGEIAQVPPRFSAIKIDGERAYDLAREGEEVVLAARPVIIDSLELVSVPNGDHAEFEAVCGKGTYVRALARDIGRALGTHGHVVALRRMSVGPFQAETAVQVAPLEALFDAEPEARLAAQTALLQPVASALTQLVCIPVSHNDAARLHRGQPVLLRGRDAPVMAGLVYVTAGGNLVALADVEQGELVPKRVFKLAGART